MARLDTGEADELFLATFVKDPAAAARYRWAARRRPGTRLERAERLWAEQKELLRDA